MYFKQFYLGCLAHASYLIGSDGEAAVIDPQRDIDQYIEEADANGLRIKYVIETHLHADFVSGHTELAKRTGAQIIFGKEAKAKFHHLAATDGDVYRVGAVDLRIVETPGHTPESICIFATDRSDASAPPKLLSGDTLFVGDVGRPDLVAAKGFTAEQMARMMYHSLHEKILKLPDDTEIWPAHGAGSLCGKQLSTERTSTLGLQRRINYALQDIDEDAFVQMLIANQPEIPQYFSSDVRMNWEGPRMLADVPAPVALTVGQASRKRVAGAMFLDVRPGEDFAAWHIPGSLNIPLSGQFASWAGSLIHVGTPIVLIAQYEAAVSEAVVRLARVGIESVVGYMESGMDAWFNADGDIRKYEMVSVDQLHCEREANRHLFVLDVRRRSEYKAGHVPGAVNIPLAELSTRGSELPQHTEITVICASGYRSSIAASILERAGFDNIRNVAGGTNAWRNAGFMVQETDRALA
jgi:glyoxylase-like metal-dependent hydrolase (beta-lactamase superfamily II)/rhodanese-related sulfurtransferase